MKSHVNVTSSGFGRERRRSASSLSRNWILIHWVTRVTGSLLSLALSHSLPHSHGQAERWRDGRDGSAGAATYTGAAHRLLTSQSQSRVSPKNIESSTTRLGSSGGRWGALPPLHDGAAARFSATPGVSPTCRKWCLMHIAYLTTQNCPPVTNMATFFQ